MPQASDIQRKEWADEDGVGEYKAINYLESKGYKLSRGWVWILPNSDHAPTNHELGAINFLVDEWDFGGYVKSEEELK